MPLAVYLLGLAIFAQGTSEFMLSGLLPEIAADLGITIPDAGLLISAFAVGMLVGAPVLAIVTLRWPRRTSLLTFTAVFIAAHVVGALTASYGVLLATRIVAAFAYAGFWAVAAVATVSMVAPGARGKAMAIVTGGLTIATILGVPAGTFIGQHLGWRAAFWAVAAMSALAAIGIPATIRGGRPAAESMPRLRRELRTMAEPRLWLAYGVAALSACSVIVIFSYLGTLLTATTGLPEGWVPVVLALFGVGSLTGIILGSRFGDTRPFAALYAGTAGIVAVSVLLALTATSVAPVAVLVFLLGGFGFFVNPALNVRIYAIAGEARTIAGATATSAFNVGVVLAPWLGGLTIAAGFGYPSVAWAGAAIGVVTLGAIALASALHRAPAPRASEGQPVTS
ncbi:Cmx/CmrA family chloramphenicol efflux MFS transporter [Sphaerisporangium corydalis]|uniref:Cmx/CmrA family chloramphenicol efflux MFS transporter n=1 Tax=Sphaerisporangium corydalis TaxID=1441875 RepID=A0ABV9ELF0_9ACTN|nr:Cmx/CmrA family chloramphenicol efflux MFS transporter [Sphaerisporangium corydalis]